MPSKSKANTIASKLHPSPPLRRGRGSRSIIGFNNNGTPFHIPTRKKRKSTQLQVIKNMNVRKEAANIARKMLENTQRKQMKILEKKLPNDLAKYIMNMIRIHPV